MSKIIALVLFIIPLNVFTQQKLQFIGENIDFAINKEHFSVNGIYYFFNNSETDIKQTILFPFSERTDSIIIQRVFNLTYSENLSFQPLSEAIVFKLFVLPKDTVKVNISYSQKTNKENIYILKSTQTWGKALLKAEYSLRLDSSVKIDSFSLVPDSLINNIYYWKKQNFYPNENFKVWIK